MPPDANTVTVSFTAPNGPWAITPHTLPMPQPGAIHFVQDPTNAPWTFVSVNLTPTANWASNPTRNGTGYVLNDPGSPNPTTYHYTVTVAIGTTQYTGPVGATGDEPPIIMNGGTTGEPQY